MTDYEYIMAQCRKYHFTKWDDDELRKCVDMLVGLSREQLVLLYTNRWIKEEKILKEEIFRILFKDKIGKREKLANKEE